MPRAPVSSSQPIHDACGDKVFEQGGPMLDGPLPRDLPGGEERLLETLVRVGPVAGSACFLTTFGEKPGVRRHAVAPDELLNDLLAWRKSVAAPIPTRPNPDYEPAKGPKGGAKAKKSKAGVE
jgi:hypothetical protein